jgi:hypothetical protein
MALPLVGFAEGGFVSLHDPMQMGRLDLGWEGEEAVTPAEGGVLMHTAATRCCPHRLPLNEGLGVLAPALAVSQPCQRRAGERVERLAAGGAAQPRQPMCLPPTPPDRMMAMRAGPAGIEDDGQRIRCRPPLWLQPFDGLLPLCRCQLLRLRQPIAECRGMHGVNLHVFHTYHKDSWRQHLTQT